MSIIKNKINNEEMPKDENEKSFFDAGKRVIQEVMPSKELLTRILNKIEIKSVTNNQAVRNISMKAEDEGRNSTNNNFTNLINNMNNYIKILSGGAIVSALIIALVIMNKPSDSLKPVFTKNDNSPVSASMPVTKVEVSGVALDVDSLVADLETIDSTFEEPMIDDSDLTAGLISASNYEI